MTTGTRRPTSLRCSAEGRYNDQVWWLPQGRSTPLFYYNKEVFEQAGLPDRAPETWSEFREWGNQIKGSDYRGEKISMRAYSGTDDWYIQGLSWNFGGGYSDENLNLIMSEQGMLDALAFDRAVIHEDKSSYVASDMVVDFTNGLVATVCTSTGSLGGIVEEADFEFGAGFLPTRGRGRGAHRRRWHLPDEERLRGVQGRGDRGHEVPRHPGELGRLDAGQRLPARTRSPPRSPRSSPPGSSRPPPSAWRSTSCRSRGSPTPCG